MPVRAKLTLTSRSKSLPPLPLSASSFLRASSSSSNLSTAVSEVQPQIACAHSILRTVLAVPAAALTSAAPMLVLSPFSCNYHHILCYATHFRARPPSAPNSPQAFRPFSSPAPRASQLAAPLPAPTCRAHLAFVPSMSGRLSVSHKCASTHMHTSTHTIRNKASQPHVDHSHVYTFCTTPGSV